MKHDLLTMFAVVAEPFTHCTTREGSKVLQGGSFQGHSCDNDWVALFSSRVLWSSEVVVMASWWLRKMWKTWGWWLRKFSKVQLNHVTCWVADIFHAPPVQHTIHSNWAHPVSKDYSISKKFSCPFCQCYWCMVSGQYIQPKWDLTHFIKWPEYIHLQWQKIILMLEGATSHCTVLTHPRQEHSYSIVQAP